MMEYIQVPDMNDSFSRVILCQKEYLIRFLYNGEHDYWSFGVYDTGKNILLQHRKIVPVAPLTHFDVSVHIPQGIFGCFTNLKHVGRKDFANGNVEFAFIPWEDLEVWRKENEIIR
ncbi:phage baseplate plug family protein [Parablautia intestinalis]|nr:hypothetical protein [Parablautia intestinalis]